MSDSDFPQSYDEWLATVPEATKKSSVWRLRVYQLALFVFQVSQRDIETLKQKKARSDLINQLYRAAGSVPANIVEGYGRNSGKERRHFFEVALGSAREVDLWYQESESLLGATVVEYRRKVLSRLCGGLVKLLPLQRNLKEGQQPYDEK